MFSVFVQELGVVVQLCGMSSFRIEESERFGHHCLGQPSLAAQRHPPSHIVRYRSELNLT